MATQGITGGIDKLVSDAGVDRKAQQQMKANAYVSELLGKATPEDYQQQLLSASNMSPYASPELMKQVDTSRAGFQRTEDVNRQLDRYAAEDSRWGAGHTLALDEAAYKKIRDKELMDFDKYKFRVETGLKNRELSIQAEAKKALLEQKDKGKEMTPAQRHAAEMELNKPVVIEYIRNGKKHTTTVPYGEYISMTSAGRVGKKGNDEYTTYSIGGGRQKTLGGYVTGLAKPNPLLETKEELNRIKTASDMLELEKEKENWFEGKYRYTFGRD